MSIPVGKGLFTTVGGFHADPSDPNAPGKDAKWDELGSLEQLKDIYKVGKALFCDVAFANCASGLEPNYSRLH